MIGQVTKFASIATLWTQVDAESSKQKIFEEHGRDQTVKSTSPVSETYKKFDRNQIKQKKHHPRFTPENLEKQRSNRKVEKTHKGATRKPYRTLQNISDDDGEMEWEDESEKEDDKEWQPSRKTCQRAVNRLKNESLDYNEFLYKAAENPDEIYFDESFTFPDSIHWKDLPGQWPLEGDVAYVEWKRIMNKYGDESFSLWGDEKINPKDAIQGQLGNCWLISAAMSIAEDPQRIRDIFQIQKKNSAGIYATKMWLLGMPVTVVLDDYLPLEKWPSQDARYAQVASDGALWGTIFEKSFAKYLGMYEAIDAGSGAHGVEAMTGSPYDTIYHQQLIDEDRNEELWEKLVSTDMERAMVTNGTPTGTGSDQDSNADGLPYNHALSVMRVLTVTDDEGDSHRLVELRNPWGMERFFGDWSDSSDRWTESLLEQTDHTFGDDGKFYMSFNDYISQVEYTDFNRDVSDWHHSAFAMLGDDKPLNREEIMWNDLQEYNVHTLILTSPVAQKIQLSMHSYHYKQYHGECGSGMFDSEILVKKQGDDFLHLVNPASIHDEIMEVEAGSEFEVQVFTSFADTDLLPHDWSLVVWADQEPISIKHADGLKSGNFFNVDIDELAPIPQNFTDSAGQDSFGPMSLSGAKIHEISLDSDKVYSTIVGSRNSTYIDEMITKIEDEGFYVYLTASDGDHVTWMSIATDRLPSGEVAMIQTEYEEFYISECESEGTSCYGSYDLTVWQVNFILDNERDQIHLNYTFTDSKDFLMAQVYDKGEQTWKREIFDNEELVFEKTWQSSLETSAPLDVRYEMDFSTTEAEFFNTYEMMTFYSDDLISHYVSTSIDQDDSYEEITSDLFLIIKPSPERFYVQVLDTKNEAFLGELICNLGENAELEEECTDSLKIDDKSYKLSHRLNISCIYFSFEKILSQSTCFDRYQNLFNRTNEWADGGEQSQTWQLDQLENPVEVIVTDLTGTSNLHFDVRLNITAQSDEPQEPQDIHLTGFLNQDKTNWSWTIQSGQDPRLMIKSYRDDTDVYWSIYENRTPQIKLKCSLYDFYCKSNDEEIELWQFDYKVISYENVNFQFTDKLGRTISMTIDSTYEQVDWVIKGADLQEIDSRTFYYWYPYQKQEERWEQNDVNQLNEYTIEETLDSYDYMISNYTLAITKDGMESPLFNTTFILPGGMPGTSVIADLGAGRVVYLGCQTYWEEANDCTQEQDVFGFNFLLYSKRDRIHVIVKATEEGGNESIPTMAFIASSDPSDGSFVLRRFERFIESEDSKLVKKWPSSDPEPINDDPILTNETNWYVSYERLDEDKSYHIDEIHIVNNNTDGTKLFIDVLSEQTNSTSYLQQFTVIDYSSNTNIKYAQVLRFNETDRSFAVRDMSTGFAGVMQQENSLMLEPGFINSTNTYRREGEYNVTSYLDSQLFSQSIRNEAYDFCIISTIDLVKYETSWSFIGSDCYDEQLWSSETRPVQIGEGPLFEPEEPMEQFDEEQSFAAGYDQGLTKGLEEGAANYASTEAELEPEQLERFASEFPGWVSKQRMYQSVFACDSDIRLDRPFFDDATLWAFWANHDCTDYDLLLNIIFDEEAELNMLGYMGAELSAKECMKADHLAKGVIACQFELKAGGTNFGALFKGGFHPVYYTQEWVSHGAWTPAFSFW